MSDKNVINSNKEFNAKTIFQEIIHISNSLEREKNKLKPLVEKDDNNSLCFYFDNKEKIYNERRTKLLNKEHYLCLIHILDEFLITNNEYIFLFFKKINVDLFKVIINGYINFELNEQEKNDVYIFITNILPFYLEKRIFFFIYNKLSKIFRKFHLSKNKKELYDKFIKVLDVWKLLYKVENVSKVNQFYIAFLGKNNITIDLTHFNKKKLKINSINVTYEFAPYFPYQINEKQEYFNFFKVYYNYIEPKEVKLNSIKKSDLENLNKIKFKLTNGFISYFVNESSDYENGNKNIINGFLLDNKTQIVIIELLNNYIGSIKSIKIILELQKGKIEYELALNENKEKDEKCYKFERISESNDKEGNIQLNLNSLNEDFIDYKMKKEIFYDDIRYYGGLECFIPILKIIKYFIKEFKDNSQNITHLNKYITEIMKTILNLIYFNKKNYLNFKDILVPLIGAMAEINNVLPLNYQKDLYNNAIFSIFYILIISSSFSLAQKKAYINITGLDEVNKLNLKFDDLIVDINKLDSSCFEWYSKILYIYIQFVIMIFNDCSLIKDNIFNQLINLYEIGLKKGDDELLKTNSLIKFLIGILIYICDMKDVKKYERINNINKFLEDNSDSFGINQDYYIKNIIIIMKFYFNLINFDVIFPKKKEYKDNIINEDEFKNILDSSNDVENNVVHGKYKIKFQKIFGGLEEVFAKPNGVDDIKKQKYLKSFKSYYKDKFFIEKIFNVKDKKTFDLESDIIIKELTDYHGQYHKLMKNLFLFNHLWSDKKLFYDPHKKELLKYKYVNYYTTNFQRPFLLPIIDYKYSYPILSDFKIQKNFYIEKYGENEDDYNFYLDCPEFDKFCIEYEKEIFRKMENELQMNINSYDVCLVKRTHHVKGKLYVLNKDGLILKIIFCSFPYDIAKNTPCCNVNKNIQNLNHNKEKLCFGETFVCPKKDMNRKKIIKIDIVRLVLRRIYFYRKTAIEIFTNTKSYYFNFAEDVNVENSEKGEMNSQILINMLGYYYKTVFFPIRIQKTLIGYSRDFGEILNKYNENKKYDLIEKENKFISVLFDHYRPSEKYPEYSSLDMILYLNLLSNRSFVDLFQYPVFPLLFLFEKDDFQKFIYHPRELKLHIGFQEISEKSSMRKKMINDSFKEALKNKEKENNDEYEEASYFKTHYSNNIYTCNYLIRFFPFSFLAIEFQGNDFDNPNRLFFSIEDTFYNVTFQKSDIRELIPEFYYFPEMFLNINKINFHEKTDGTLVNDVEIPKNLDFFDNNENDKINSDNNNNKNKIVDKEEESNYYRCFKFVEKMRNLLESKSGEINFWINLIFGNKAKYLSSRNEDQFFRKEAYIDFSDKKEEEFKKYIKNKDTLLSVDFGISPVQTLFNQKEIFNYENRSIIYDKKVKDNKELYQSIFDEFINILDDQKEITRKRSNSAVTKNVERRSSLNYVNRYSKLYLDNKIDYVSNSKKIIKTKYQKDNIELNGYKTGKVDIILNKKLYDELYDHNDEITFISYNKRLNMFCTTSKDGFLNLYIYPNKLMTSIKNPNGHYFNIAFLSSNPFPSVVAFEENNYELYSYSINGFFIKKANVLNLLGWEKKKSQLEIYNKFNERGGTYKDRLIIIDENIKGKIFKCQIFTLPFFDKEEEKFEIKKSFKILNIFE